jgi:glycerate kinase
VDVDAVFATRLGTAVVELAVAAGLGLFAVSAPLTATTRGAGELILAALETGARWIVLGIGGSARTDGGAGMLEALGVRLLDAAGAELARGGAALADLDRVDVSGADRPSTTQDSGRTTRGSASSAHGGAALGARRRAADRMWLPRPAVGAS